MTGLNDKKGKVFLVGAGPGAPGLLTVRGRAVLSEAEVVVFDALANHSLLRYAPAQCEFIDAGKRAGLHRLKQSEINELIVNKALEGNCVVRLKGGDPFLFGRGGEEAEALEQAGVPYEVIPGISSAYAVPAYAGIPLTRRGSASAVHIFTAHHAAEDDVRDWTAAAHLGGTLVFLMGFERIGDIAAALIVAGMPPTTPAAVVQWGTTINQRQVFSTLRSVAADVERAKLGAPAVFVVGETAAESSRLHWMDELPFFGRTIAFTREERRAIPWLETFEGYGARALDFPMVQTKALVPDFESDAVLTSLPSFQWIVFTNSLGVEIFADAMRQRGMDARSLAGIKIASVGLGTAQSLRQFGINADLIPTRMSQEGLAAELPFAPAMRILLPGSPHMRGTIDRAAQEHGAEVVRLPLYESELVPESRDELIEALEAREINALVLVAPQVPQMLAQTRPHLNRLLEGVKVVCLGAQAATVLQEHRRPADAVLEQPTLEALVTVLRELL